jgi:dynein heavy chain
MYSVEEEKVDFVRVIDTALAEGAVERWLVEIEDCMIKSVHEMIHNALVDYPKKPRHEWVLQHKG